MNTNFVSNFADRLSRFLEHKQALGYLYNGSFSDLKIFDRMCAERFSDRVELSAEICNAWATRRNNESNRTLARRLPFIREFARYLIRTGEQAYILPGRMLKKDQRYIPHIYSHAEIFKIWHALERIFPTKAYPAGHIVMPTLMRLIYCCGLRPSEALKLRLEDVDLRSGKLFIVESKGHKDRIVMMADDVRNFCLDYDKKICEYIPNRMFFFAKNAFSACDYRWVSFVFQQIREFLHIEGNRGNRPRLYDMRHSFATHRLYRWMREGKDLHVMLPYLSSYMGHSSLTETFYYVHLIPGMFEAMSGFKYKSVTDIFPEVVEAYE